jgi:hypothetical protein
LDGGTTAAQQTGPAQFGTAEPRIVALGRDGKYHIVTSADAAAAAADAPQFGIPSLAGEFSNLASSPILIGPTMQSYVNGQIVFAPLPNAPPGTKTFVDRGFDWAEGRLAAYYNWARENKAEAAIAALSLAVSFAMPELPAVAALGPLGSALVSGLTAPVLATSTTSFINKLASTGRTDKAALAAIKDSALVMLNGLPSAVAGETAVQVSTGLGAPKLINKLAEYGGSYAGDLAVQYGPSILTQPIPVNYQSTVSFKPQLAR